jgi:hypothetical protein
MSRDTVSADAARFLADQAAQRALETMREELVRALEDMPLSLNQNKSQAIELIRQLQTIRTLRRKVNATAKAGQRPTPVVQPQPKDPRWD